MRLAVPVETTSMKGSAVVEPVPQTVQMQESTLDEVFRAR